MRIVFPLLFLFVFSSFSFGGVESSKDSTGKTLAQVRDAYFQRYISFEKGLGKITQVDHQGKTTRHYLLHNVTYKSHSNLLVTEADRLNGISLKTMSVIQSKSYRDRLPTSNKWSEWKSGSAMVLTWATIYIERKNGMFKVTPVSGSKYIKKVRKKPSKAPRTLRDLAQ